MALDGIRPLLIAAGLREQVSYFLVILNSIISFGVSLLTAAGLQERVYSRFVTPYHMRTKYEFSSLKLYVA